MASTRHWASETMGASSLTSSECTTSISSDATSRSPCCSGAATGAGGAVAPGRPSCTTVSAIEAGPGRRVMATIAASGRNPPTRRIISISWEGLTADRASSSTITRGRATSARARANRCRCPPDRVRPRSPTWVLSPSGIPATMSSAPAAYRAALISSSDTIHAAPRSRFWRSDPENSTGSSATMRTIVRMVVTSSSPRDRPSSSTSPLVGSTRPPTKPASVVLPEPGGPFTTTIWPGRASNERRSITGLPPKETPASRSSMDSKRLAAGRPSVGRAPSESTSASRLWAVRRNCQELASSSSSWAMAMTYPATWKVTRNTPTDS